LLTLHDCITRHGTKILKCSTLNDVYKNQALGTVPFPIWGTVLYKLFSRSVSLHYSDTAHYTDPHATDISFSMTPCVCVLTQMSLYVSY